MVVGTWVSAGDEKRLVLSRFQKAISPGIACGCDIKVCKVILAAFGYNQNKPNQTQFQ
jgi:hypothetical protein